MSELATALLDALDADDLAALAERLRPYLDREDPGRLLGPQEAAERLGLHAKTVSRMAREGRIPGAVKVGKGWRFPADQLAAQPPTRRSEGPIRRRLPARHVPGRTSVAAIRGEA